MSQVSRGLPVYKPMAFGLNQALTCCPLPWDSLCAINGNLPQQWVAVAFLLKCVAASFNASEACLCFACQSASALGCPRRTPSM